MQQHLAVDAAGVAAAASTTVSLRSIGGLEAATVARAEMATAGAAMAVVSRGVVPTAVARAAVAREAARAGLAAARARRA